MGYRSVVVNYGDQFPTDVPAAAEDSPLFYKATTDAQGAAGFYVYDEAFAAWRLQNASVFPIGYVYLSMDSTDPATVLGFGTWALIAQGRALVGVDTADPDFDTAGKTTGEKMHQLTVSEIPAHDHPENAPSSASGGTIKLANDTNASGSVSSGLTTGQTGGGAPHNNVQPSFALYVWQRTA